MQLRRDDLATRFPGLLDAAIAAARAERLAKAQAAAAAKKAAAKSQGRRNGVTPIAEYPPILTARGPTYGLAVSRDVPLRFSWFSRHRIARCSAGAGNTSTSRRLPCRISWLQFRGKGKAEVTVLQLRPFDP
jgi:hypothetical protein